jgi:hypothetical protein
MTIQAQTRRKDWIVPERRMMARASRIYGPRLIVLGAAAAVLIAVCYRAIAFLAR